MGTWKDSTNAGRAFVFAQVGVPFISGPDFETAELLGDAKMAMDEYSAITQAEWESNVLRLLNDHALRQEANRKLLTYAKERLDIIKEGRRLEAALASRVTERRLKKPS